MLTTLTLIGAGLFAICLFLLGFKMAIKPQWYRFFQAKFLLKPNTPEEFRQRRQEFRKILEKGISESDIIITRITGIGLMINSVIFELVVLSKLF